MNFKGKLLIIDRTDIQEASKQKKAIEIIPTDLKTKSHKALLAADIAIVVFETGTTSIIKNRYGAEGVVVSKGSYEKYLNPNNENSKFNSGTKKKSFLARIFGEHTWPFNRS